mmetsp:Transcript_98538/g.195465  ORF Transcript_98538/g.195465 Transcript_98538/m.195465 type:complete len:200 (+) Transcript_98538:1932-2531(+)
MPLLLRHAPCMHCPRPTEPSANNDGPHHHDRPAQALHQDDTRNVQAETPLGGQSHTIAPHYRSAQRGGGLQQRQPERLSDMGPPSVPAHTSSLPAPVARMQNSSRRRLLAAHHGTTPQHWRCSKHLGIGDRPPQQMLQKYGSLQSSAATAAPHVSPSFCLALAVPAASVGFAHCADGHFYKATALHDGVTHHHSAATCE